MHPRSSYREAAVRGASPVQLVIYLYEQAIEDVRCAILALEKGDIEARTRALNHALAVIAQLQGSLDNQRGGEVSCNLHRFYNLLRSRLIEAQFHQSAKILELQLNELSTVHQAWLELERMTSPAPASGQTAPPAPVARRTSSTLDWDA